MIEDQLKELQNLLSQYQVSLGPLLQNVRKYVKDASDTLSVTSDTGWVSNASEGIPKMRFHLDYLVFGYYTNEGQSYQNKSRSNPLDIELYDVIVGSDLTKEYAPPWSKEEPVLVHERENVVNIVMSPFTAVLGTASGFNCFCENTFYKLDFEEFRMVRIRYPHDPSEIDPFWVKGIVIPKTYPQENCSKLCKEIKSNGFGLNVNHYVSSGIGISENCSVDIH